MTEQHKATPEQWESIERYAEDNVYDACFLELRARVEILEATQHAHIDTSRLSDEERDQIRQDLARPARIEALEATQQRPPHQDKLDRLIALDAADDGEPIVMPNSSASLTSSPAGSLVERLMDVLGHYGDGTVCAVILEVAAWLRGRNSRVAASVQIAGDLEKEAN